MYVAQLLTATEVDVRIGERKPRRVKRHGSRWPRYLVIKQSAPNNNPSGGLEREGRVMEWFQSFGGGDYHFVKRMVFFSFRDASDFFAEICKLII